MKIGVLYRSPLGDAVLRPVNELRYRDDNFADRAGWKEVVAVAESGAIIVTSSVPERDRSGGLSDYPTDLLSSPPQDIEARVTFAAQAAVVAAPPAPPPRPPRPGSSARPAAAPAPAEAVALPDVPGAAPLALVPSRQETPRNAFTALVATPRLGLSVVLLALVTALGVGALHALEPGHGKTVVAAYLVGSRGTAWHAVFLGLVVTASHTAGVFLLGLVTLYASRVIVPERIYPWLGAASGFTIAGLGVWLFLRRYAGGAAHGGHARDHHHGDDHGHAHGELARHGPGGLHHHHHHATDRPGSLRELFALGLTGGIVPCPAALVVLLSALALRRIGFGLVLIVAFSVGLAAVLIAIGLVMVYARRFMSRVQGNGPLVTRWLPLTSAAVITLLGMVIAVQALVAGGIVQVRL
jgi:ABC-type nickel/cobalt efflux system permease component RcnA